MFVCHNTIQDIMIRLTAQYQPRQRYVNLEHRFTPSLIAGTKSLCTPREPELPDSI